MTNNSSLIIITISQTQQVSPTCPWALVMIWLVSPGARMGVEVRELRKCGCAPRDAALNWTREHVSHH